jgi:hypothetical protein
MLRKRFHLIQVLITLVIVVLFFQGKGAHGVFTALWLLLPVLSFCVSKIFREKIRLKLKFNIQRIKDYKKDTALVPPWGSIFIFVILPFLILCLLNGRSISSYDNLPVNLTAASLVIDKNTDVSEFFPAQESDKCHEKNLPYSLRCIGAKVYSSYPAGMLIFATPVFTISSLVGGDIKNGRAQWRLAKWTAAWVSAFSLGIIFLLLLQISTVSAAFVTVGFLGVGSTFISTTGQGLWTRKRRN